MCERIHWMNKSFRWRFSKCF